jgi:hypothetical protein
LLEKQNKTKKEKKDSDRGRRRALRAFVSTGVSCPSLCEPGSKQQQQQQQQQEESLISIGGVSLSLLEAENF